MSEFDVESEIYESLYGVPRRERTEVGPGRAPIVIVDGALGAAPLEMDTVAAVTPSRGGAPWRPLTDHRRAAVTLAAALVVVPLLALLLAAAGSSGTARVHLAPAPSRSSAPALAAIARPAPAPRHSPASAPASASATGAQAADTAIANNAATRTQARAHRTRTTSRPHRVVARPTPPPPIRRPTAHERPAPKRPTTTAPAPGTDTGAPSDQGGGITNLTGGQPAPPG